MRLFETLFSLIGGLIALVVGVIGSLIGFIFSLFGGALGLFIGLPMLILLLILGVLLFPALLWVAGIVLGIVLVTRIAQRRGYIRITSRRDGSQANREFMRR